MAETPHSSELGAGAIRIEKSQYNNLRRDVLDAASGHNHTGELNRGRRLPNSALATASVAPSASSVMLRDAASNSQVGIPTQNADIARLDTFSDIRLSRHHWAPDIVTTTTTWAVATSFTVTLVRPCLIFVFLSGTFAGVDHFGREYHLRLVIDTGSAEQTNGVSSALGTQFMFFAHQVAAGTRQIRLETRISSDTGTSRNIRIFAFTVPIS